jgi:rRNA biogenesis protein RRP5
VLPLHLILSLPNNLLAHVSITEISTTLTKLLSVEQDAMSVSEDEHDNEDEEEEDKPESAPDLAALFRPGQYFPAKVLTLYPTASQSFISQYPVTETTRLASRVEVTLIPEKVNSDVGKQDLTEGFTLFGEVKEEEDKGWRIGLGVKSAGAAEIEGWLSTEAAKKASNGT